MSSEQQHVRVIISLVVLLCVMAALLAVSLTRPDFITKLSGVNDIEIVNLDADVYLHDEEMVMIDVVSDATTTEAIPYRPCAF
jgi:hypothetical protein